MNKKEFLDLIRSNIDRYGFHITMVSSKTEPRYAYTIGLIKKFGFELIFAGGLYYLKDEVYEIFDLTVKEFEKKDNIFDHKKMFSRLGTFSFKYVDNSWSKVMMLGVYDYYGIEEFTAIQIIPETHFTYDVPKMTNERNSDREPVWKWLDQKWNIAVPEYSTAVTNLDALQGKIITEVMRWENDEWEIFAGAGSDVLQKEMRVVPISTLLGIDQSLELILLLEKDKGLWRDPDEKKWNAWG